MCIESWPVGEQFRNVGEIMTDVIGVTLGGDVYAYSLVVRRGRRARRPQGSGSSSTTEREAGIPSAERYHARMTSQRQY